MSYSGLLSVLLYQKFFFPGICIPIAHVGEDKKNFVQIVGIGITIRQEIYLDFLKKFTKVFSFYRKRCQSFQLFLDIKDTVVADTGFAPDMLGKRELVWCGVALRLSGF